jgi:hypothetical protein
VVPRELIDEPAADRRRLEGHEGNRDEGPLCALQSPLDLDSVRPAQSRHLHR